MQLWQLVAIIVGLLGVMTVVISLILRAHKQPKNDAKMQAAEAAQKAEADIEHIFDDAFREELRNRGRLYFEKIIGENAMFLQQDLRLTASQLNEYMKQEISKTLQEEFKKYEESITDAQQVAIKSIDKTRDTIEQQRQVLSKQLEDELKAEKERYMQRFEKNMAEIVNHYILAAVGNQISLDDQLDYILSDLEASKKEIIDDIKTGA